MAHVNGELIPGRITKYSGKPAKLGKQGEIVQPPLLVVILEIQNTPENARWIAALNTWRPGVDIALEKRPERQLSMDGVLDEVVAQVNNGALGEGVTASRT